MLSGANAFEINDIQEDETERPPKTPRRLNILHVTYTRPLRMFFISDALLILARHKPLFGNDGAPGRGKILANAAR
jgi:hypothetical protein